jgi:hypothetical protein
MKMATSFKSRGVVPSQVTANALRELVNELGDREVAKRLGQSRSAVVRIAARLPVNPSILYAAEAKLGLQQVA